MLARESGEPLASFYAEPIQDVDMEKMRSRVHNLPPEIFETIKECFFTTPPPTIRIEEHYMPPVELQISHQTRYTFVSFYYVSTTFIFSCLHHDLALRWLASLPDPHLLQVNRIELRVKWPAVQPQERMVRLVARPYLNYLRVRLLMSRWMRSCC